MLSYVFSMVFSYQLGNPSFIWWLADLFFFLIFFVILFMKFNRKGVYIKYLVAHQINKPCVFYLLFNTFVTHFTLIFCTLVDMPILCASDLIPLQQIVFRFEYESDCRSNPIQTHIVNGVESISKWSYLLEQLNSLKDSSAGKISDVPFHWWNSRII